MNMPEGHEFSSRGHRPGHRPRVSEDFGPDPERVAVAIDYVTHLESLFGSVRPFQGREPSQFSGGVAPGY